jgi:transcriptional regulator of NAD metabolism
MVKNGSKGGDFMEAIERRNIILETINASDGCITGAELATLLNVTRQVIVQDIALLRASGINIVATPTGYMMFNAVKRSRPIKVFTCRHETLEQTEEELMIIVKNGGKVRDVIIEHPVYGEITGMLMLSTPEGVKNLIERLRQKDSRPLSSTTGGVHMHTVEADSEAALKTIETQLKDAGLLI